MTNNKFVEKLISISESRNRGVVLRINPQLDKLPLPIARYDDPFLPFGKEIIRATSDLVCGYLFDLSSYMALGGAGMVALERTIRYVPPELVRIIHGPFYGGGYASMMSELAFGIDAVTLVSVADTSQYAGAIVMGSTVDYPVTYQNSEIRVVVSDAPEEKVTQIFVTDDAILYAGNLEHYADEIRNAILQRQWSS